MPKSLMINWQQMNKAGDNLVKSYGPNQGADIDNYYHPLLQCQLAKISPTSRDWGLRLGYAKEILDYHKKKGTMPMSEISADSRKDLQNNLYGSIWGIIIRIKVAGRCWMTKERQICVRPILDKIVSFIYRCVGYIVILAILVFFLYPYYQEYDYMKNCQQDGRSKSQCEQTWKELRALD